MSCKYSLSVGRWRAEGAASSIQTTPLPPSPISGILGTIELVVLESFDKLFLEIDDVCLQQNHNHVHISQQKSYKNKHEYDSEADYSLINH